MTGKERCVHLPRQAVLSLYPYVVFEIVPVNDRQSEKGLAHYTNKLNKFQITSTPPEKRRASKFQTQ
jgi:hypothetical protein